MENFGYHYPPSTTERFQSVISSKKEFSSLSATVGHDQGSSKNVFFPHQLLGARFYKYYDYGIINHAPGTGKTGYMFACGEMFRIGYNTKNPVEAYMRGLCNTIRRVHIIVPGPTNVAILTNEEYPKFSRLDVMPDYYEVMGADEFHNKYNSYSDEEIRNTFSNTAIFRDEAHDAVVRSKIDEDRPKYDLLRRISRLSTGVKLLLFTGTVLVESGDELTNFLELNPHIRESIPSFSKEYRESTDISDLDSRIGRYIDGNVSYLENLQRYSILEYPESISTVDGETWELVTLGELYDQLEKKYDKKYGKSEKPLESVINHPRKYLPLLMTPEQSIPFKDKGSVRSADARTNSIISKKDIDYSNINTVGRYAIKLSFLLRYLQKIDSDHEDGLVFIITSYAEKGTQIMRELLTKNDYVEYNPKVTTKQRGRPSLKLLEKHKQLDAKDDYRRFIIIEPTETKGPTGKIENRNQENIKFTKELQNMYGRNVRIIISSPVGGQSISLHYVTHYIEIDPAWNESTEEQRFSRLVRPDSYRAMYYDKIDKLRDRGEYVPENFRITINMLHLVAIPRIPKAFDRSSDAQTYMKSIIKNEPLEQIRQIERNRAYDAWIHIERNSRGDNIIEPAYNKPIEEDLSTYLRLYYSDEQSLIKFADDLVSEYNININEYVDRPENSHVNRLWFFRSINDTLKKGGKLITSIGSYIYIGHYESIIFMQNIPQDIITDIWHPDTAIYSNPHFAENHPLYLLTKGYIFGGSTIEELEAWLNKSYQDTFEEGGLEDEDILAKQIESIENIVIGGLDNINDFWNYVMNRYLSSFIFVLNSQFNLLKSFSISRTAHSLREYENNSNRASIITENLSPYELVTDDILEGIVMGHNVVLHLFYAQQRETDKTKHTIYTDHLQARQLYKLDMGLKKFVQLSQDNPDYYIYKAIISRYINDKYNKFSESIREISPEYGGVHIIKYEPENIPRLVDNRSYEGRTISRPKTKISRGKEFKSFNYIKLVEYALYLDADEDGNTRNYEKSDDDRYIPVLMSPEIMQYEEILSYLARDIADNKEMPTVCKTIYKPHSKFILECIDQLTPKQEIIKRKYINKIVLFGNWINLAEEAASGAKKQATIRIIESISKRLESLGQYYKFGADPTRSVVSISRLPQIQQKEPILNIVNIESLPKLTVMTASAAIDIKSLKRKDLLKLCTSRRNEGIISKDINCRKLKNKELIELLS